MLAVDDHPINRDLLARQIRLLGIRAETAENGQAALSLWHNGNFAMVITDCNMPEMDGYELAREIRKMESSDPLRKRTPVIAWTANALPEESNNCHTAGMDDLLVKPATLAQLKQTLAKWISIDESSANFEITKQPINENNSESVTIDYSILNMIVKDSTEQQHVLNDFHSHIRDDYSKLLKVMEQGDINNVENISHRMKGSSRMVGAQNMANACAAIEQAARAGDWGVVRDAKVMLEKSLSELETFLLEIAN